MKNLTQYEYDTISEEEFTKYISFVVDSFEFDNFMKVEFGKFHLDMKDGVLCLWFKNEILASWKFFYFQLNGKSWLVNSIVAIC